MHTIGSWAVVAASVALAFTSGAGQPLAPDERPILGVQGSCVAPDGRTISVTTKCLRFDGVPRIPVMGEMHYARVPEDEWRGYVRKMKDGGLTIVASYVFWIHHEEKEGVFDFSGRRDIGRFLSICEEEGMQVVLRMGPYCHGECLNGGFPEWLVDRGLDRRSTDAEYLAAVERFWTALFAEVDGHLWKQGGCVVGVQLENECRGPWPYFAALKALARRIGFDVPFYAKTLWPPVKGKVPYGELLPFWGEYADGFWERKLGPSPGNYLRAYDFTTVRASANIATEQLPQSAKDDGMTAMYPYFMCELGGGMPSAYHRRLRVTAMDTYAMALVKLGSGANLLGYYMYAGGTNPNRPSEGVFLAERQASKRTNYNDLPPFSYEFYAAISEFGETTRVHALLKVLHKFCANFAADFVLETPEIVDAHNARRGPFRFHSEYVRVKNVDAVPYIFPENWKTKAGTIRRATAQPLEWRGDTLVMMKIPGFAPDVEFEGKPFKVEFVDFPAETPERGASAAQTRSVAVKPTKAAGPPRQVRRGARNVAEQPGEDDWKDAAVWEVALPEDAGRDWILEVEYLGDCARVYVDDVPVADDFYKGLPLRCALWRMPKGRTTVRILPWGDSPLIYVQEPYRPEKTGAEIFAAGIRKRQP